MTASKDSASKMVGQFEAWLIQQRQGMSTARKYRRIAEKFCSDVKTGPRASLTEVHAWRDALLTTRSSDGTVHTAAASTVNVRIAALRAFFAFAVEMKLRSDNPMKDCGVKFLAVPERKARPIRRDLLAKIFDVVYDAPPLPVAVQDRALIEVLYGSGLRRTEAAVLRLGDFAVKGQLRLIGKGNKERITITTPEEMAAVSAWAILKLSDAAAVLLRHDLKDRGLRPEIVAEAVFEDLCRRRPEAPLFYVVRNGEVTNVPMHEMADPGYRVWLRAGEWFRAIGEELTTHQFRHAFATGLFSQGANRDEVGELLGHTDRRSTQIYTAVDDTFISRLSQLHPRSQFAKVAV